MMIQKQHLYSNKHTTEIQRNTGTHTKQQMGGWSHTQCVWGTCLYRNETAKQTWMSGKKLIGKDRWATKTGKIKPVVSLYF